MSPNRQQCGVCGELVDADKTESHLADVHPTPSEGFQFFYDARPYRTSRPSMQVAELLALVGGSLTYQFYEERESLIPLSHGQAVDLTNGPKRFCSIPAARS